jgi:hypothetical protein
MAHPGNVEMAFALPIQILLAQIPVATLEQDREKTQLIFFADVGHVGSANVLSKRANTQLSRNARQLFDWGSRREAIANPRSGAFQTADLNCCGEAA